MTRAQFCQGRTGVQPGAISSRTGQPINCGGGTAPAPQVASAAIGNLVAGTRLSRAQVCNDPAGRTFVNGATGLPVRCGPQSQSVSGATGPLAAAPRIAATAQAPRVNNPLLSPPGVRAPVATVTAPSPVLNAPAAMAPAAPQGVAPAATCNIPGLAPGAGVRCGPQSVSPSGLTYGSVAPAMLTSRRAFNPFSQTPPPELVFSNPGVASQTVQTPHGFTQVWDDGRLNPRRGLPEGNAQALRAPQTAMIATQQQVIVTAKTPTVSSRSAPRTPAVAAHALVQIGTFASRADAQQVAKDLRARGLPMRIGVYTRGGTQYRMVLAGPFGSSSQTARALNTVRGAGYSGAFTRN